MELYVRADRNDHTVVDHFLTPSGTLFGAPRQPISAVVADAHIAALRGQLSRLTSDAGVPYVIDPVTPLLQSEQAPDDSWAQLPFAHAEPLNLADLSDYVLDELVDRTFTFQREHGATDLIPPYFYSNKRLDGWWSANIALARRSADYLERNSIDLPVLPTVALALREYGPAATWEKGLDVYLDATKGFNADRVALSWSWNDPPKSKDALLSLLLGATQHAAAQRTVIGWRSGTFGHALAAVGAAGYETGIGSASRSRAIASVSGSRPQAPSWTATGQPAKPCGRARPRATTGPRPS